MYDYYVKFADCIEPDFLPATTPLGLRLWLEDCGEAVYDESVINYGGYGITLVCVDHASRKPRYIMSYAGIHTLMRLGKEQGIFD